MIRVLAFFSTFLLFSCSSVSITERKQMIILNDNIIYPQAFKAYEDFKKKEKLIKEGEELEKIIRVTNKLKLAINSYYKKLNEQDPTSNFLWEIVLVDNNKVKNAWCMPGGKMAIYSGILGIISNEDALAAVIGHEIAHAVARHGTERASQSLILDIGTIALEKFVIGRPLTKDNRKLYDYFTSIGIMLPFSRKHEMEADYLGLVFMHFAGYNLDEAYKIWEKMSKSNNGESLPKFLSTHPSSKTRIKNIKKWIPIIQKSFEKSNF